MKRSLVLFFLTILLLCAAFLHAANNNKGHFKVKKEKKEAIKMEVQKNMEFVPNVIVL